MSTAWVLRLRERPQPCGANRVARRNTVNGLHPTVAAPTGRTEASGASAPRARNPWGGAHPEAGPRPLALLLTRLRREFKRLADPKKAPQMQAYMKSAMPYYGVPIPQVRAVCKKVFADVSFDTQAGWQAEVLYIWRHARYREERYAALNLCAHKLARTFQNPDAMVMYEELVVTGAW